MIILSATFSSFSQTDTTGNKKVILSEEIARLTVKDLVHYDALKVQLVRTEELLATYRSQSETKDALIVNLQKQNSNLSIQVEQTRIMYEKSEKMASDLYKGYKKEKAKSKFFSVTTGIAAILALVAISQ